MIYGRKQWRDDFRVTGVRNVLQISPIFRAPRRALMGKGMRLVKVEGINNIAIGQRLQQQKLFNRRPTRTCRYDGMPGGSFTNRGRQSGLDAGPAIRVLDHRLVQDFKEYMLRVTPRKVRSKSLPESSKCFDVFVICTKF